MPTRALFEGSADPREVPDVFFRREAASRVLRAKNPRVVRQPTAGVGARVGVDELPRRRHADGLAVEGEFLRILNEVEQMCVTAGEFIFAVDPERVIPDDPTATEQSQFTLE